MTIAIIWILANLNAPWWLYILVAVGFILKCAMLTKGEKNDDVH